MERIITKPVVIMLEGHRILFEVNDMIDVKHYSARDRIVAAGEKRKAREKEAALKKEKIRKSIELAPVPDEPDADVDNITLAKEKFDTDLENSGITRENGEYKYEDGTPVSGSELDKIGEAEQELAGLADELEKVERIGPDSLDDETDEVSDDYLSLQPDDPGIPIDDNGLESGKYADEDIRMSIANDLAENGFMPKFLTELESEFSI